MVLALKTGSVPKGKAGKMRKAIVLSMLASAAVAAEAWTVPNWSTIVTEPDCIEQYIGKTRCGHCQGMCVSSNAIYFSFFNQIVKTDWYGRLLKRIEVDIHNGDICYWNGRLYTGVWLKPPKGSDEKWCAQICMYDADTLELLKSAKMDWDGGADGITCLDGVVYLALGGRGTYDPEKKCGRMECYRKFDAETLEPIGDVIKIDHGYNSLCGSQNMTTDGTYIYSSHYTEDEAAGTPNLIVHDKDFNVVAMYRLGRNNGLDFVPGGRDGAVRFAWVFTPNWMNWGKKWVEQEPRVSAVVQFAEIKDGKVTDLTYHAGFRHHIQR